MKRPSLIRIKHSLATLDVANDEIPLFYNPLHYHPELELTFVEKSSGTRIIGDSIESFMPGDLVLVGANTPHIWKNEVCYDPEGNPIPAKAIVIKFLPDFAGTSFWEIPEMIHVKRLIYETSVQGIKMEGKLQHNIEKKMKTMLHEPSSNQIICLLEILLLISQSNEYRLLSNLPNNQKNDIRISKIISFLQTNYHKEIDLETISTIIFMHKNAICHFFKKKTGKTIFEILHEIRIKRACDLLINTTDPIEVIGSTVGYFSQSLFNRKFKEICKMSPTVYRKNWINVNNE
ncbi:AraC family transcriptional regulator [Parabacteroides sp. BX2]|uniref:AraC family transcriptional regulator n=1 Tax=Parabacteroides segnis TaxID=2763058 RepID=A0ABR7DZ33_9BACT|nr:AraC family transcriptional regulator [Parabacteroides sp.]MBC5642780.1 AraC family transcriptional regulator [Parabacteroides segnis]MCM0713808.1 AraC family transcriptional regulator [Parabacteroides sp. TA-V-105]